MGRQNASSDPNRLFVFQWRMAVENSTALYPYTLGAKEAVSYPASNAATNAAAITTKGKQTHKLPEA